MNRKVVDNQADRHEEGRPLPCRDAGREATAPRGVLSLWMKHLLGRKMFAPRGIGIIAGVKRRSCRDVRRREGGPRDPRRRQHHHPAQGGTAVGHIGLPRTAIAEASLAGCGHLVVAVSRAVLFNSFNLLSQRTRTKTRTMTMTDKRLAYFCTPFVHESTACCVWFASPVQSSPVQSSPVLLSRELHERNKANFCIV
jgi:hypothetical protein